MVKLNGVSQATGDLAGNRFQDRDFFQAEHSLFNAMNIDDTQRWAVGKNWHRKHGAKLFFFDFWEIDEPGVLHGFAQGQGHSLLGDPASYP